LTFIDQFCEPGDGWISREELYNRYMEFVKSNGFKLSSQTSFNKEIEGFFPNARRGQDKVSGRRVWRGINFVEGGKE
jgi:hypothetical protein